MDGLIVGSGIFGLINYEDSVRQRQVLVDIRKHTEKGITYNYIHKPLLKTFRMYHTSAENVSMKKLFKASFDSLISDDSLYQYMGEREEDSPQIHVAEVTDDRIVLVGVSNM